MAQTSRALELQSKVPHITNIIVGMTHDVFAKEQSEKPATQNQSTATYSQSGESGRRGSHRHVRFDERIDDGGVSFEHACREYKVGRDFSTSRIAEMIPNIVAMRTDVRNTIFGEWTNS